MSADVISMPSFDFSILREIRKRSGMTLNDLSEKSGVSLGVISKLERNQSQAEVNTLFKIGRVFGMRATDILTLTEAPLSNKKRSNEYYSDGFQLQSVRYAKAKCIMASAKSGARISKPDVHHDDHEIFWVLKCAIRLTLPKESHDLKAGESIQFDAIQEHSYEALKDSEMMIVLLLKDKRF